MQQPHHSVELRQPFEVKREPRNDQKWNPQQAMEAFPKQMIYPRSHPSHKLMQQQQQLHQHQVQAQQQYLHAQHAGMPVGPAAASSHGGPYKVPIFNFTAHDLGVYLYGKQDLRMVRIESRSADGNKQQKDKGKPAKWCDMCQEIRFGECHKHGPLTSAPSHSAVPINAPMSYAISTFPDEVGLCISGLPFAGYGVFARQTIPTGTWIGPYEGTRIPFEEGVKKMNKDTPFLWEICANGRVSHFLDASDENSSSWMRFIQCARFKEEQNLFVFQYCATIYYRAFKDVPPGVELLVWYDEKYPHLFGLPLEINDMATCSVESIQTSGDMKQPPGEGLMSTSAMIPSSGSSHPSDVAHAQAAEMMRRDLGKGSSSSVSSSFAFPRPTGMTHPAAPPHLASSGGFHAGPLPVHIRQRQDLPHPAAMSVYGQQLPGGPVSMRQSSPAISASGPPSGPGMQDETRPPNAPLPVQLIDKARAAHEEAAHYGVADAKMDTTTLMPNDAVSQVPSSAAATAPGRVMLGRPVGSSSSLASDGSNEERKTPDKPAQYHPDFVAVPFGPNSWQWTCNNCGKSFNHKSMLHNHVCTRPSQPGPYRRDRSPFNDGADPREHLEAHRDRPYKCRFCARTFAGATTLNNHMRTHTGERMFEGPRRLGNA